MIKGFNQYINEQYSNPQEMIDIKYGNPQKWQKESMDSGSNLLNEVKKTDLWKIWTSSVPPDQNSEEVKKDLESLVMLGNSLTEEEKEFIADSEKDMLDVFEKFLKLNGVDQIKKEDLEKITDELDPITFILKYIFNYPRPLQLALAYNIPLYPQQPTNACSPAYPSGHSIDAFVIAGLLSKKYPQLSKDISSLAERMSKSRNQGGIHFSFDSAFGKKIAEDILSLNILSL
jgi:acid phosphatase (class A)